MFEFETEVEVDDIDGSRKGKATIKWNLELECRSWGVKSIIISVRDQEFKGWLEKKDDCTQENFEAQREEITFMIKDVKVLHPVDIHGWGIVSPHCLTIVHGQFKLEF